MNAPAILNPKAMLQQAGFKATPGRVALLKLLRETQKPLSIQDIRKQLTGKKLDQATVYRVLEALRSKGIIEMVNMEHGHAHFELVSAHHHHAICTNCGKVVDVSRCKTKKLDEEVKKIAGFTNIYRHSLEFFGLCKSCAAKLPKSKH